jgi:Leu/Phe-tRNA-protein transferase
VILRLRQNPRAILPGREAHIKLEQNPRRQRADLHVSQVLANAAKGPHGEGRESVLVLDQLVALAVPALGEEGRCFGVDAVVWRGRRVLVGGFYGLG